MSLRSSFRTKLFMLAIVPLVVAQVVTLLAVMETVERDVEARARESLRIGGRVVGEFLATRGRQLATSVEVLAADFGLKQAAATGDSETIRSVLENHSLRVGADLAAFVDMDGRIVAASGQAEAGSPAFAADDLDALLGYRPMQSAIPLGGHRYHLISVPLMAPVQIGWVVVGFDIGESTLAGIRELTGMEARIADGTAHEGGDVYVATDSHGEWLSLNVPYVRGGGDLAVVLRRSLQDAMLPYQDARRGLVLFGLALLTAVVTAAAWLSGSIAQPLKKLTDAARRISAGRYDIAVDVTATDEIGDLASSFAAMKTAIAEREKRISHQALHDPVTGLANRSKLAAIIDDVVRTGKRRAAVLSIRILRMNSIASTLGHGAGDEVVKLAARLLQANLEYGELLGQIGTNEFVLVLPDRGVTDALECADKVEGILGAGVTLERVNIGLQTEIGIAEAPGHAGNADDLLRAASIARSEAEARQERVMVYESGREAHYVRQLRIMNDLRASLQAGEIVLAYQPKVALPDGAFCGAEALVRWQHPEFGLLYPDSFIPVAEEAGTIVHLTRHVLTGAIRQCRQWQDDGIDAGISVNVSARDLQDEYLPYFVLQELKDNGIPAARLTLEITENSVMQDVNHAVTVLECLRDIGIRISIDDFGTGHSSLAQLKIMPLHELKIDKSFVMNLRDDSQDGAIVRATVELAHNLGLDVVAEGVENEDTLRRLSEAGCQQAQGYFLSKPVSPAELVEWLREYRPQRYEERRRGSRAFA